MIVLDGETLTPAAVTAVARRGEPVRLAAVARERNLRAREQIASLIAAGDQLYGATTGVGALHERPIPAAKREQLQWNLLHSHAAGAGPILAPEAVRAGMVVRANQLGCGGAGVAPELLEWLVEAINSGEIPVVHALGSVGTGDLTALAEIALALLGEGEVWRSGRLESARRRSSRPTLGLRDALGFMSSNAVTLGRAAMICTDMQALIDRWLTVAALSFEAAEADPVVLDKRVAEGRGSDFQAQVAGHMRTLLRGSDGDESARRVQDPYPFRVLPQVDAASLRAQAALGRLVAQELNAAAENALIDGGLALHNGNFHVAELAAALDALRAALAQSASLIAARVGALLDPRVTGLAPFLALEPGVQSGAMMLEYTAHSAAAQVRSLALPAAVQTAVLSLGVETHATFAATAAALTEAALEAMVVLVATELVVAVRALRMADRQASGQGSGALFEQAGAVLPASLEDRPLAGDVQAAVRLLRDGG